MAGTQRMRSGGLIIAMGQQLLHIQTFTDLGLALADSLDIQGDSKPLRQICLLMRGFKANTGALF